MDLGAVRLLARDVAFTTMGVDATVTIPGGSPVQSRVVWTTPVSETLPVGHDLAVRDTRRTLAISRADVPTVPRGTLISAAEYAGAPVRLWKVDNIDRQDADQVRVIVKAVPES